MQKIICTDGTVNINKDLLNRCETYRLALIDCKESELDIPFSKGIMILMEKFIVKEMIETTDMDKIMKIIEISNYWNFDKYLLRQKKELLKHILEKIYFYMFHSISFDILYKHACENMEDSDIWKSIICLCLNMRMHVIRLDEYDQNKFEDMLKGVYKFRTNIKAKCDKTPNGHPNLRLEIEGGNVNHIINLIGVGISGTEKWNELYDGLKNGYQIFIQFDEKTYIGCDNHYICISICDEICSIPNSIKLRLRKRDYKSDFMKLIESQEFRNMIKKMK